MATGVDAKLLKSTKFPSDFNKKVDMQKVNLQVMKKWVPPSLIALPKLYANGCSYLTDGLQAGFPKFSTMMTMSL